MVGDFLLLCHTLSIMYKSLIKKAGYMGVVIFLLNLVANKFYWYTAIFGFDKFMHTLGGMFIVFIVSSFYSKKFAGQDSWRIFVTLVLSAFVIGLVWEYYEYIVQYFIKGVQLANVTDSIGDLIFDSIGGAIGSIFVISINKRYNRKDE